MQLILSIDDIGIKKNMSSVDETNQSEKKIKTEIIDNNLTSSPSPSNITEEDPKKHDKIVDSSRVNITNETNGIASRHGALVDDENSSKISDSRELKNIESLIPDNEEEGLGIHSNKIKTETGDENSSKIADSYVENLQSLIPDNEEGGMDIHRNKIKTETGDENSSKIADSYVEIPQSLIPDNEEEGLDIQTNKIKTETGDENSSKIADSCVKNPQSLIPENEKDGLDIHTNKINTETGDENSSKIADSCVENPQSLIPENEKEGLDIHTNKIVTETGDNLSPEECSNNSQEEKLSSHDICEENIDRNINSDIKLYVKSEELNERECQDENVSNINENEDESKLQNKKNKRESCEYEEISEELETNTSAGDAIISSEEVLSQHQHSDENVKEHQLSEENGNYDNVSSSDKKVVEGKRIDDIDNDVIDNVISDNVENCQIENRKSGQHTTEGTVQDNSTTCTVSDEVIDIADERDSPNKVSEDIDNSIEDKSTHINEGDIKNQSVNDDQHKGKGPITIDEDIIDIADEKDSCDSIADVTNPEYNILRKKLESGSSDKPVYTTSGDIDARICNERSNKAIEYSDSKLKKSESTDKVTSYKLSNTLDILSDEEDESHTTKPDSPKPKQQSETNDKQCINIEEDDDIMVIDDESSTKDEKNTTKEKKTDEELIIPKKDNEKNTKDILFKMQQSTDKDSEESRKRNETNTEISKSEIIKNVFPRSPLLSSTTLKSFKKNLAEMTREELEDFCILTIAEAVFDRSNLGELKSQMKILTQNFEEHKLKAKNLAKQNRDLQVVLKSIQEEQKKNSDAPITPLKITRSVGMQVLMTEKVSRKRQAMLTGQILQNSSPTKQVTPTANKHLNKQATSTNISNTKTPPRQAQQQIPVPRLVPAVNPVTKPSPNSSPQVNNVKSPVNVPNGVKTVPSVAKPEKRTHTKMQQSSAVTVDLTDDEPPAKVVTRNFNSPVRCVPPQSLLAPRPSLPMTSPRKVYIPISGQQAQNIRPGQHIMLKSVTGVPGAPGRPRGPSPNMKVGPNTAAQIRPRIAQRHPAPLPELMKQYQPPNWKALPPAPELKLAKVENGIVISWKIDGYREENHEEIASYQLFAYQETSQPPNTSLWKKIGDVKALPLPMACTLTQFMSGYKYYFAVRAVDVKSRFGPFSLPGSILLLKN